MPIGLVSNDSKSWRTWLVDPSRFDRFDDVILILSSHLTLSKIATEMSSIPP